MWSCARWLGLLSEQSVSRAFPSGSPLLSTPLFLQQDKWGRPFKLGEGGFGIVYKVRSEDGCWALMLRER